MSPSTLRNPPYGVASPPRLPRVSRAAPSDLTSNIRWVSLLIALGLSAIGTGWIIASGHATVVAVFLLIAALIALAVRAPGPLAALLLLAVLNGLPLVNLSGRLPGGAHYQDGAVIALGLLLLAYRDREPSAARRHLSRIATTWAACFVAYWIATVARSALLDNIPLLKAMLYGRDFLYFAVLLPAALRVRFTTSSFRAGAYVLLGGIIVFAIGTLVVSLTGASLPSLVHPDYLDSSEGVTRVYSLMYDLLDTTLILVAAFLLSQSSRGRRLGPSVLALILLIAALLQLTRANYFALAAALVTGAFAHVLRFGSIGAMMLRTTVVALVVCAAALSVITISGSSNVAAAPVVNTVVSRVASGVSSLSQSSGTVAYRENVDSKMLHVLGSSWPLGLGFLHPAADYIPTLPFGAIRNADTGFFNGLMTMGIVGLAFIYAPLAYALGKLLRIRRTQRHHGQAPREWLISGGAGWLAWAATGSLTLIVLFSISGLVITASVLAILANFAVKPTAVQSRSSVSAPR